LKLSLKIALLPMENNLMEMFGLKEPFLHLEQMIRANLNLAVKVEL